MRRQIKRTRLTDQQRGRSRRDSEDREAVERIQNNAGLVGAAVAAILKTVRRSRGMLGPCTGAMAAVAAILKTVRRSVGYEILEVVVAAVAAILKTVRRNVAPLMLSPAGAAVAAILKTVRRTQAGTRRHGSVGPQSPRF